MDSQPDDSKSVPYRERAEGDDTPSTTSKIPGSNPRRRSSMDSAERPPLPLPSRHDTIRLLDSTRERGILPGPQIKKQSAKQNLQSKATTALSLMDISSQSNSDDAKDVHNPGFTPSLLGQRLKAKTSLSQLTIARGSEIADSASIRSYLPNPEKAEEDSIFGDFIQTGFNCDSNLVSDRDDDFESEFEPVGELAADGHNEEVLLERWKAKQKHYLILSTAGKPIYTRHGDSSLVSRYTGIIQTIISSYWESDNPLRSFSAGNAKFVVLIQGPLYLVAISRILESETQLRLQLEALYAQILSTLTLPTLTRLFSIRPSTDLKRPLEGTENLLSTLADTFTKGSPTTLLSALECLRVRKSYRQSINNVLLKTRIGSLLYGLVVAGGRLVSVIRPKKHSLHPGDLQLLFNMIFEADGVKAGGGESWIPVCLPGFNSSGYLHMYVSFLDLRSDVGVVADETTPKDETVAIILISPDKESFFQLQEMRNSLVERMERNGSMKVIKEAIQKGRPSPADIIPGTALRHFVYKSKAHVQFVMSSYAPDFLLIPQRRRLLSTYHALHASIHAKSTHVRVHHNVSRSLSSFAWVTPSFELYCITDPNMNRNSASQNAGKIVQWIQQEEERVFIVGGAVF